MIYFRFYLSLGCIISFALAKHMIDTKNKGDLIQLMVQMGRGPVHLKSQKKIIYFFVYVKIYI